MIKVIAFDYADVISPSSVSKWVRENLTPKDNKYHHYKKYSHKWDIGEMTLNEIYDALSHVTGIPDHLIWDNFYKNLDVDREVIEIIIQLKKNYKVFLFSNYVGELLRKLLEKQKITNLFDEIIISSEHKLKKPDPEFFKILTNKANVKNDEILFIDDRLENVEGAKNLGINALQFIDSQKLLEDLKALNIKFI
nr:HAD family phosphatase [Candidatus Levybacteria bacterium]